MLARGALEIFDDLLARALRCLSHRPLLSGNDEPETLSYQIALFGPIGADVRHDYLAAAGPLDIFDDLLTMAFACCRGLSQLPLFSGYHEPRTHSYQIQRFSTISADVRHSVPRTSRAIMPLREGKPIFNRIV